MKARKRFSWTVAGCLIILAAFVTGCSLDSGNPLATPDPNESSLWAADDSSAPEVMAKKAGTPGASKGKGKNKGQSTDTSTDPSGDEQGTGTQGEGETASEGPWIFEPVRISPRFNGSMVCTEFITKSNGGTLQLISTNGSPPTKIKVIFPERSVKKDTEMTLTLMDPEALDFQVKPSMRLNREAKLQVKGTFIVPEGGDLGLFHHDGEEEGWSKVSGVKTSTVYENGKWITVMEANVKILLNHFSRYAFGSRTK